MPENEKKRSHPAGDPVRAAQVRALISNYVISREEPVLGQTILDDLTPEVEKLGLTRGGAYYHLRTMGQNGLLGASVKSGNKTYYTKPGAAKTAESQQPVQPSVAATDNPSLKPVLRSGVATQANMRMTIDVVQSTGRVRITVAGLEIDIGVANK